MATIGDTMVTLLTDNWAGAGAAPTFGHLVDYQKDLEPTTEQVLVRLPIHEDVTPINDTYSNFKYTIQLRVKSTVSDDRLKVLADETIRIINTYAITGITRQFAKRGENTSDRKRQVFSYDVWAILEEHVSAGGTAYSSPGAGDVAFPAAVTVAGTLDVIGWTTTNAFTANISIDGNPNSSLGPTTITGNATVTGNSTLLGTLYDGVDELTIAQLADLLMFGSANAAWVNCPFEGGQPTAGWQMNADGQITNVDNTAAWIIYSVPLPTNRGGLKLYISGTRVSLSDADAGDYINRTDTLGYTITGKVDLDLDATVKNTVALHTDTFTAVDCSSYYATKIRLDANCTDAGDLDIQYVLAQVYYAA